MLEISVIIPTLNSRRFIKPCLDSIFTQAFRDFEVIVVDNGSRDDTVNLIKKSYSQIRLIENRENLGACEARNQAIEIAQGEWVLALDCDIVLEKGFLDRIIRLPKEIGDSVGVFQPKILNSDARTIYSCGIYISNLRRFYDIGRGRPDNGQFNSPRHIFGACSAAALYKREMLEELKEETGYFDKRFFFLAEDVDLACRAQKRGWKALFYPDAVCYHAGDSSGTPKRLRQFLCWRNRKFLLEKFPINKFKLSAIFMLYDFPRLVLLFLANRYVRNEVLRTHKKSRG